MAKDIIEIARSIQSFYTNILQKSDLTEMKMHKLLYFAQKKHYENFGEWLFEDDFQGWVHGPVNRKVRSSYFNIFVSEDSTNLTLEEELTIREIIFEYGDYPAEVLSEMSHDEDAYKISRQGLGPKEIGTRTIKKSDIIKDIITFDSDYSDECEVRQ
ncbi:Panacea domain-containing protein [Mesobacillus stamsii]|uniref:Phage-associated protein n=1 Tax=Mesobacillus stamsii TaxID=225347 RepID=A0ABU0FS44_9BACI|nr:type II toxin-antitoxin system antitoxin SocA domain-containing protein [Mesobacillus stamsii]MDQ0412742.1 putative phage-associated protein [Mesobacillus stamsii]